MKGQEKMVMKPTRRATVEFVGSRAWSMDRQRTQALFLVVLLSVLTGCSSNPKTIPFQNITHRQLYSLNEEDLKKVQFYISTDVVAQYQDTTGRKSVLVPRLTPGVVTAAGQNWVKVSFRKGGVDVPFVTDPNQYDGRYRLATEVVGSKDFKEVTEVPGNIFLYKGTPLRVVSGADALLLIDPESWKKVIEQRKVTEGRRVGGQ
jgi:hypothetical protein